MSCEIVFLHNVYQIFVFSVVLQTTPHHTPSIASTSRPSDTILCCDQLHGHDLKNVETFVFQFVADWPVSMCRLLLVFSNQLRPKSPTPSLKKPNTHRTLALVYRSLRSPPSFVWSWRPSDTILCCDQCNAGPCQTIHDAFAPAFSVVVAMYHSLQAPAIYHIHLKSP